MSIVSFPECRGPRDLPEIRAWLSNLYRKDSRYTAAIHRAGLSTDSRFIRETLNTAKLWWVTKETCELLAASAPTIPDDVVLDWKDVPIPSGFALFEEDLSGTDANEPDASVRVSAIMWGPVELPPIGAAKVQPNLYASQGPGRIGLGIGMWTRADLSAGLTGKMIAIHAGTFAALTESEPALSDLGPGPSTHVMRGNLFTYIGRTDWLDGRPVTEITPGAPLGSYAAKQSMTEDRKLITALWAITRTPIVSLVQEHPDRATARRAKRKGYDPDVRVLTLHGPRIEQPTDVEGTGNTTRNYRVQWIVSPHWRWQACGPNHTQRRLTLIPAYRKGPSDKPLLGGERVWRVVPPHGAPG